MRIGSSTVEAARSVSVADIIDERGLELAGRGFEWSGPCPICGGTDRFAINLRKNVWNCRGCGRGGDPISLVRHIDGVGFPAAVASLNGSATAARRDQAQQKSEAEVAAERYAVGQLRKARDLYRLSKPAARTVVESYLRKRGINNVPPSIRAVTYRRDQPLSMLACYGPIGEPPPAIHLTYLKVDGSGKAEMEPNKITIASPAGQPIVIAPTNNTRRLAITEGIEDALSVHQATGLLSMGGW